MICKFGEIRVLQNLTLHCSALSSQLIATVHHRHAHTSHHGSTVPDSLVLVTVGDTPPEGRVAVVDTGNTVGVIRTPAPAGLDTLLIACHTSSIWEWEWEWE